MMMHNVVGNMVEKLILMMLVVVKMLILSLISLLHADQHDSHDTEIGHVKAGNNLFDWRQCIA